MKFNQLNGFVFDSESGVIGAVAGVDFIKQTVTILTDENEQVVANLADVEFLEQLGAIGSLGVINGDVVATADDKLYELVAVGTDEVQLYLLDKNLERLEAGDVIKRIDLQALAPYVTVLGNIHELEAIPTVEFNIVVVRKQDKDGIKFFYACNNADVEEVDLIKVVFVGHHLLKEETYERITLTHEEYLKMVKDGKLVETSPQALQNYVTGLMHGKQEVAVAEDDGFDIEEEEEEDFEEDCEECGENIDNCECDEW